MDMGRERLTAGSLVRLGVLLTAVCVCVHVYLETDWLEAPAPLASGHPTQSSQNEGASAEAGKQSGSVQRRISYVQTVKRYSAAKKWGRVEGDSPPHPHRKVCLTSVNF